MLHCNELPLRHLLASLDGPTSSKDGFTGPIGSFLSSVQEISNPYQEKVWCPFQRKS